jgi:hypothetical protein
LPPSHKTRALLGYLALSHHKRRREKLCETWLFGFAAGCLCHKSGSIALIQAVEESHHLAPALSSTGHYSRPPSRYSRPQNRGAVIQALPAAG